MSEGVRISACIIMRDAAEDIKECLMSLQGLVDEFVVVDTGSVDDSVSIAEAIAGKVYHLEWPEDFSTAKNYAIEKARGRWIIFLDADESLTEETRGNLPGLIARYGGEGGPDTMSILRYNVATSTEEPVGKNYAERIFRREMRYHDSIHEYLAYDDGRQKRCFRIPPEKLAIRHTGYSPERLAKKAERNLRMLEAEREMGREKQCLYYYLAELYFYKEDYGKAAEAAWESVERKERPLDDSFGAYIICYESRKALEDEEGVLSILQRGMEDSPLRPEFFALYGDRLREAGKFREAYAALKTSLRNVRDFPKNFPWERNSLDGSMAQVYGVMAEICAGLGKQAEAGKYRKKAAWEKKRR